MDGIGTHTETRFGPKTLYLKPLDEQTERVGFTLSLVVCGRRERARRLRSTCIVGSEAEGGRRPRWCCLHGKRARVSPSLNINFKVTFICSRKNEWTGIRFRATWAWLLAMSTSATEKPAGFTLVEVLMRNSSWREAVLADTW